MSTALSILLAEDNPGDAFLINEALSSAELHFRLHRVEDGGQALKALDEIEKQQGIVNLIVLDLNLPKVSGHELLARIRANQYFRETPVIVMTSSDSPEDRKQANALGVASYLRKPTDLNEFLSFGALVKAVCQRQD